MNTPSPIEFKALTIKPSGSEVFTDYRRGKTFTTLHYRFSARQPQKAFAIVQDILADLTQAGLKTNLLKFSLNLNAEKEQGYLEVQVHKTGGQP